MMKEVKYQQCKNCVMDTTDSKITFNEKGMCDHCTNFYNNIENDWIGKVNNKDALMKISEKIKKAGKGKKYDCIIGLSGGVDSSYLCYLAKEVMGLRPLLYSVDTGWNDAIANNNIKKVVDKLGFDHYVEKVDWNEMRDLQLAMLKSNTAYQDFPQDHAIFAGIYNYSVKNKIQYVLTGANTSTEGIRPPTEWVYINDIKFLRDVHKKFGGGVALKTFPLCGMLKYKLYYTLFKKMKRVAPLDYVEYNKEKVENFLKEYFGWEGYENKHYESVFTRWCEGYYLVKKFNYDKRKSYFSNLILTNQITRDEAVELLKKQPYSDEMVLADSKYIAEKLGISTDELIAFTEGQKNTYKNFKNSFFGIKIAIKITRIFGIERRNFR